jgi:NADP-reducing hydrogenase subunit HndC
LGGCLPEAQLDTPITYETMRDQGSMMGSGGLIVMDESTCMVDMARYFLGFAQKNRAATAHPAALARAF